MGLLAVAMQLARQSICNNNLTLVLAGILRLYWVKQYKWNIDSKANNNLIYKTKDDLQHFFIEETFPGT